MRKEEEHWRLKSRSLWLKNRDSNTSFFHKQAQQWRKQNTINKIQIDSKQKLEDLEQIKDAKVQHFEALYNQNIGYYDDFTT